jgi:ATP-dependent Zn protease
MSAEIEMHEDVPWFVSLIVSWLPFILIIGSFLWVGRRIARALAGDDGKSIGQAIDEHRQELKRSADLLERLVSDRKA